MQLESEMQGIATIGESALLVVDVQDSFKVAAKRWERRGPHSFEANLQRLIEAYRRAHLPVVFLLHNDGDPGFEVGVVQFNVTASPTAAWVWQQVAFQPPPVESQQVKAADLQVAQVRRHPRGVTKSVRSGAIVKQAT